MRIFVQILHVAALATFYAILFTLNTRSASNALAMSSQWKISCQYSSIFFVPLLPRVPAALRLHGWRWFEDLKRRVWGDYYRLKELAGAELRLDDFYDAPTLHEYM